MFTLELFRPALSRLVSFFWQDFKRGQKIGRHFFRWSLLQNVEFLLLLVPCDYDDKLWTTHNVFVNSLIKKNLVLKFQSNQCKTSSDIYVRKKKIILSDLKNYSVLCEGLDDILFSLGLTAPKNWPWPQSVTTNCKRLRYV